MSRDYQLENRIRKVTALREKRKEIMGLSSEKALDAILSSSSPAELVQSFSEQDLYFLSHDIGMNDALPVLALASSEQWGYMLDVEIWDKDRINLDAITYWLTVLLHADPKRAVWWLVAERLDFLELYLSKNIDVIIREENEDPSDFPDDFFTVDDYFYVRIREKPDTLPLREGEEPVSQDQLDVVVREIINQIIQIDYYLYQSIMLESMSVIHAEAEEEDFRLRNVRLSEKGFLPFDEALEVFSPLDPDLIRSQKAQRAPLSPMDPDWTPAPLSHVRQLGDANVFSESLALLEEHYDLADLEMEFASLCNQIIAAEQKVIREKEGLKAIVKKAGAYVSIGLEVLLDREPKRDDETRIRFLLDHSLKSLFRVGVDRITKLAAQARSLTRDSWYARNNLPLTFWGEQGLGVIGGLLVPKPVYYDNYTSGKSLYREFETIEDISATEDLVSGIRGFDDLLSVIEPRLSGFKDQVLTFTPLLLTLFVHARNGHGPNDEGPLTIEDMKAWYAQIWDENDAGPRTVKASERHEMLSWLAQRTGLTKDEISKRLGNHLEAIFSEFEDEYGSVEVDDLKAQYITHIYIREESSLSGI